MRFFVLVCLFGACFGLPSGEVQPRIVNGKDISIEKAPYQAAIEINGKQTCGGAIIGPENVLTAAQCVKGISESSLKVRVGAVKRQQGGQLVSVKKTIVHPKYKGKDFDLAILVLESKLNFDSAINAVALTQSANEPVNKKGILTGWGLDKEANNNGKPSDHLQSTFLPIKSFLFCLVSYPGQFLIQSMFCAGYDNGGTGPCNGDWGGPFVVDNKLVGIASWSTGCARPSRPIVFQGVGKSIDFIKSYVPI